MSSSPRLDLRPGVAEPVVLLISRREVEQADLPSVLSRLKVFLATHEDAWRYRGQKKRRPLRWRSPSSAGAAWTSTIQMGSTA